MKKKFKLVVACFLLIAIGFISFQLIKKNKKTSAVNDVLQEMNSFELKDLNNKSFKLNDLNNTTKILIYIDTSCSYCVEQVKQIAELKEELKHIDVLFISDQPIDELISFEAKHTIFNLKNVNLAYDNLSLFIERLDISTTPHLLIYNQNWKILHNHKGFLKADKLLKLLKN